LWEDDFPVIPYLSTKMQFPNIARFVQRSLTYCGVTIALVLTPFGLSSPSAAKPVPKQEIRGVWLTNIDSEVLFSRQNLDVGLERLATLKFNTIYPTVWNWGYTLYPSKVALREIGAAQRLYPDMGDTGVPSALERAQQNRDMLREAIEIGKQRSLRVIPWFEFGFMAPADSELVKRHPDWITQRKDGNKISMEGTHRRVWLNPFHPKVQAFMLELIAELMRTYDVDGLQLDDHFGLPVEFGYDPYTVKLYQQEHGGRRPPQQPKDPAWMKWRTRKITAMMGRIFQTVKKNRPSAILSVSPNPQAFSYESFLADWVDWQRRGYVEELVLQLYRDKLSRFRWELDRPEVKRARLHIPVAIGILSGLKGRPVSLKHLQDQVKLTRDRQFAGVSFFFYESLWIPGAETAPERRQGLQKLFAAPTP
jgi:uncharacterized lipoprotein YddW (UPF0748 family)